MGSKNQNWIREEALILLDFYFEHYPNLPSRDSSEIQELSELLRFFAQQLGREISDSYRNTNGMYMKLMNLNSINPDYEKKGLSAASKLEKEVFHEFADNIDGLRHLVRGIKSAILDQDLLHGFESPTDSAMSIEEQTAVRLHQYRERNAAIVKKKITKVQAEKGALACEVCAFDFVATYGEHGAGFMECHHTIPLSEVKLKQQVVLDDLILVCSNCHRMLHKTRPWLSAEELRTRIQV